jgi:anti-sigma factor RsiW
MTHLAPEELLRWRDGGGEAERERVLGHLAACDECRRRYAALVRESAAPEVDEALVREAFPLGLRVYPPAAARRPGARWALWSASGLAAALLIGWAVVLLVPRPLSDSARDSVRGGDIQLVEPVGSASGPVSFRWSSPVPAARYRVWVHDQGGAVVYSTLASQESAHPPPEVSARLRPGQRYRWQVEAYDAAGDLLARSPEREFTLAR